jgi:hypothetical protein
MVDEEVPDPAVDVSGWPDAEDAGDSLGDDSGVETSMALPLAAHPATRTAARRNTRAADHRGIRSARPVVSGREA